MDDIRVSISRIQSSSEICIAVLDGPVDLSHPCFAGANLRLLETVAGNRWGDDRASCHGTHIASVIFGQPGSPVEGIAPHCTGLIVPIFPPQADGLRCSQLDLARAIDLARGAGAHIINISGGELTDSGAPDPLLEQAIRQCEQQDILIVAAAGNDGCSCVHVPAVVPSVLAVGALNSDGSPLDESNWGPAYRDHGILAPGTGILGAVPNGGVTEKHGTSFSAAIVSGIAAGLMSLDRQNGRATGSSRIKRALLRSATPCDPARHEDCDRLLAGRLNLSQAIQVLSTQGPVTPHIRPAELFASPQPPHAPKESIIMSESLQHESIAGLAEPEHLDHHDHHDLPPAPEAEHGLSPSDIEPSCGCGGGAGKCGCKPKPAGKPFVYALGTIGYDFKNEARRDSLMQQSGKNLASPSAMLEYLKQDPTAAASITWTLSLEAATVYSILPSGPFAAKGYERLEEFLQAQLSEGVERVSIPGIVNGSTKLLNGQQVPRILPELRGMFSWSTPELVKAVLGEAPTESDAGANYAERASAVTNFLDRIYYELRNLGSAPQDRALNYAATNAFQAGSVFSAAMQADLKLDKLDVERSPACRPGADCWDVKLTFFNPMRRIEQARRVYRFTVDVSDIVPVTVGRIRNWDIY